MTCLTDLKLRARKLSLIVACLLCSGCCTEDECSPNEFWWSNCEPASHWIHVHRTETIVFSFEETVLGEASEETVPVWFLYLENTTTRVQVSGNKYMMEFCKDASFPDHGEEVLLLGVQRCPGEEAELATCIDTMEKDGPDYPGPSWTVAVSGDCSVAH